jgi:hypothetical protein
MRLKRLFFTTVKDAVLNLRYPFLPQCKKQTTSNVCRSHLLLMTFYASHYLQATCLHGGHTPTIVKQKIVI